MRNIPFLLVLFSLLNSLQVQAQIQVKATISRLVPDGVHTTGSIALDVSGGEEPYHFLWHPSGVNSKDLLNAPDSLHTVTVVDSHYDTVSYSYRLGYQVKWGHMNGTLFRNDSMLTGPTYTTRPSALSLSALRPDVNGWAEMVLENFSSPFLVGFSAHPSLLFPGDITDIDFGFSIEPGNALLAWDMGSPIYLDTYQEGDVVRIGRDESGFYLSKNNVVLHTRSFGIGQNLRLKVSLEQDMLLNLGTSFADSTTGRALRVFSLIDHLKAGEGDYDGAISARVSGGASPYTYHWEPIPLEFNSPNLGVTQGEYTLKVKDYSGDSLMYRYQIGYKSVWSSFNGIVQEGDVLTKEGPHDNENASALGRNILPAAESGWLEVVTPELTGPFLLGFLDAAVTENIGNHMDMDFGFHMTYDHLLYAYAYGMFTYLGEVETGDVIRIWKDNGRFYLSRNQQALYYVDMDGSKDLKPKILMDGLSKVFNIGSSFNTGFRASVQKFHAGYDDFHSGAVSLLPAGGAMPYHYTWPDGDNSDTKTGLFPGSYAVRVRDAEHQELLKIIDIGVQPSWNIRKNVVYRADSVNLIREDSLGLFVSHNMSFSGEASWFEIKAGDVGSEYAFGFIGNSREEMDTTVQPPVFPPAGLSSKMGLLTGICQEAFLDNLSYSATGELELPTEFGDMFFVRVRQNEVIILMNGAPETSYTFQAGDLLKTGRRENGSVYLRINDRDVFIAETDFSGKFLVSSLVLKSRISELSGMGIFTNGTEENYKYRLSKSPACIGENCRNWTVTRTFDEHGNTASESKNYYDSFGRATQQQQKSMTEGYVIATENLYDSYGRIAGSTLPAPLFHGSLCYAPNFFSNTSDQHYSVYDFDKPVTGNNLSGERANPAGAGNTVMGTLGWYYSNNNTSNAYVPADAFPYNRIEYSDDPLSRVVKTAGVGRMHKAGSGRETQIFYMNGGNELKAVYRKILSSPQMNTYELDDDFKAPMYGNSYDVNILNPHKTVVINADGHDQITYRSSSGKILATCTSGNDPKDCAAARVHNPLSTGRRILIHIPKEQNTSLKITDPAGGTASVNDCSPKLWLYTTKNQLVLNTDYTYNTTTGAITFLGHYASKDLYLEISYDQLATSAPYPDFMESHVVGYTNWTVYYYDIKGRLKALISPNEFVCPTVPLTTQVNDSGPYAFSCDNSMLTRISLDATRTDPSDRLDAIVEFEPVFRVFSELTAPLSSQDFQLQSDTSLAPVDTLRQTASLSAFTGSLVPLLSDSTMIFYHDSTYQLGQAQLADSAYKEIGRRSIRYKGDYILGRELPTGTPVYLEDRPLHFDYTLEIQGGKARFRNNLPGDKLMFYLDSTDLEEATHLVVKSANLEIQLDNFPEAPLSAFNPCDLSLYVGPADAALLSSINANISLNASAKVIATPQSTLAVTAPVLYSRKFYYNEYGHPVAEESPDEGRKDYIYDLKEDKLLFSQDDRQRASGGKFTYRKYDRYGRQTEEGEFDPAISDATTPNYKFQTYADYKNNVPPGSGFTSVGVLAAAAQNLPVSPRCTDATVIGYDLPYTGTSGFRYLNGKVSYIYNDNNLVKYGYDEQGRVETTTENFHNLLPGPKTIDYFYNFFGNLVRTEYRKGTSDQFIEYYTYDRDQRLKETSYATYSPAHAPVPPYPTAKMNYYMHGPLKRKVLGDNLQGLDYVYTITGALKSVNSPHTDISGAGDPGQDGIGASPTRFPDLWSYALDYYPHDYERAGTQQEKTYTAGAFGELNISYTGQARAVRWRSGSGSPLMYEYNYDELYRLTDAEYGSYAISSNSVAFSGTGSYKLSGITYDRNGNIQSLRRYAYTSSPATPVLMDDLNYVYDTWKKNRLQRVSDQVTASLGLGAEVDFPDQGATFNYTYDEVGRMSSNHQDNHVYEYNYRGQVTRIRTSTSVLIAEFGYNSAGKRQWKKSYNSSGTQVGTMVYQYDAFGRQFCTYERTNFNPGILPTVKDYHLHAGGRIGIHEVASGQPFFELSDHLGNVRLVFTEPTGTLSPITQITDYYPHGGPLPNNYFSGPAYRYGYQGQEKDPETGLTNFELRQMDPRLGRWLNPDPMGQHHSPYLSMSNNPVNHIDPSGGQDRRAQYFDSKTGKDVSDRYHTPGGTNLIWVGGVTDQKRAASEMRWQAAQEAADAAQRTEETRNLLEAKFVDGIRKAYYRNYVKAHRNKAGDWGAWEQWAVVEYEKTFFSRGKGAEATYQIVDMTLYTTFNTSDAFRVLSYNDMNFEGDPYERGTGKGADQGGGSAQSSGGTDFKAPNAEVQSINFAFSFGGGYSFEIGLITDSKTKENKYFFSHGPTIGFGLSIGGNVKEVRATKGGSFSIKDYEGAGSGYNAGYILGAEYSGNRTNSNYQSSDWKLGGDNYNQFGWSAGFGLDFGLMWSRTNTTFIK